MLYARLTAHDLTGTNINVIYGAILLKTIFFPIKGRNLKRKERQERRNDTVFNHFKLLQKIQQ